MLSASQPNAAETFSLFLMLVSAIVPPIKLSYAKFLIPCVYAFVLKSYKVG